jgi:hypothetical protein
MNLGKQFLTILGVIALGTSVYASSAQAATLQRCEAMANPVRQAQCACEAALEQNTVEALEEFLARYGDLNTACTARAFVPYNNNRPDNDREINTPPGSPS